MMVGTFLAFDKHLNVILSECEEYRIRRKGFFLFFLNFLLIDT